MKVAPFGLRGKELSLILIVLVCATFLIWTWDRTPLLTAFLPPKMRLLQLPPDIQTGASVTASLSSELQTNVSKDISALEEKEAENNEEEQSSNVAAPADPGKSSSYSVTTSVQNKELQTNVSNNIPALEEKEAENNQEQSSNDATPADPSKSSSHSVTTSVQNKDEEDANPRQIPEVQENHHAESSTDMIEQGKHKLILGSEISKQEEQSMDTASASSRHASSTVRGGNDKNMTILGDSQGCNYAKGKWVVDENRPLYSGFGCKNWLSQMWACRLMQRQDFGFEKLRWQPKDCQMEQFGRSKFFKRMQDKTLAFVGDSLGRQQFQSLMCMITGGEERSDVVDVGAQYGLVIRRGSARPNGWAYWFPSTNTTVLYYWSASLCDLEPINVTNPATDYAMHLDRPPAFLRQYLHKFDVLVLNTGHHWNRGKFRANKWIMYVGGAPNTNRKLIQIGDAKNFAIHSIVKWVNSQLPKHPRLKAFYRSISPRHFVNGDWNTGGSCNNTRPMSIGKEVLQDESSDYSAGSAVKGTGVKLLDITALSQLRDEGHISRFSITASAGGQDCLHWCLPGIPDTWNEILFAQI